MAVRRAESGLPASGGLAHSDCGPTVLRILLGSQLRRLRTARNLTREAAGHAIRASDAKISRLELGRTGFKTRDVSDLLTLYGVTDPDEREALLSLTRSANMRGWWHEYGDVLSTWFEVYVGLEEAASVIRTYEIQFVPGLLQTEDYARAVVQLAHAPAPSDVIDQRVDLRMRRQRRLVEPEPLRLWVVADEAALRRPYGGPQVMRDQIDHLIEMASRPNITLQVIPFAQGGHPAAGGPFSILRFPLPELPDVVYLEQLTSALYFDKEEHTLHYMEVMDRLGLEIPPPSATGAFLAEIRNDIS